MDSKVLVEVTRNDIVESRHRGWVSVCDKDGKVIAGTHKQFPNFFARSSLKPVQALPFLMSKGLSKYNFSLKEIASMCSSHSGELEHRVAVQKILDTIGLKESHLKCGIHTPYSAEEAKSLMENKKEPTEIYCNCSGKHSGMLATCLINGWDLDTYYEYHHPLQVEIRKHLSYLLAVEADSLPWGIDGCGVPTYSMPLPKLALLFSKIINPDNLEQEYKENLTLIKEAFLKYPSMIAGKERIDTLLMEATPNAIVSKIGGEAVIGVGLIKEKLSIAVKIEDGANRPMLPTVIRALELVGFDINKFPALMTLKTPKVENNAKKHVGNVIANFNFL